MIRNVYFEKLFETYVSIPLEIQKEKNIIYISDFRGDSSQPIVSPSINVASSFFIRFYKGYISAI